MARMFSYLIVLVLAQVVHAESWQACKTAYDAQLDHCQLEYERTKANAEAAQITTAALPQDKRAAASKEQSALWESLQRQCSHDRDVCKNECDQATAQNDEDRQRLKMFRIGCVNRVNQILTAAYQAQGTNFDSLPVPGSDSEVVHEAANTTRAPSSLSAAQILHNLQNP